MPKIGDAPSGEKTTLDGTEKIPLTGSVWATVSRWIAYLSGEGTLATKSYVDGIAANLGKRQRVRTATTANITISTALNNGDTLDGVSLATGDLVLVKNQSAAEENGVYVVGASPARASEFDSYDEHPGSLIAVQEGTTNADTVWLCTSNVGGTLNTTAIDFSALSTGGGSVSDAAYGAGWNGDTTNAPSKNAVYDKIESMGSGSVDDTAYDATSWNGDTTHAPSKNAVRDKIESMSGVTPPATVNATDISGCINWIDLDQETGSEGDAIGTLTDRSSSANNATQGTAANKPTLRLSIANGKKGAYFDGVNDYLTYGTNIDLATNHTILIVASPFYRGNYSPLLQYKQQALYHQLSTTNHFGIYRTGDGYGGLVMGGLPQVFGLHGSSNSSYDLIHNYLKRAGSNTNSFTAASTSYLGTDVLSTGSQVASGYIFEVRIYNTKISSADLIASIDWLLYKWAGIIRH
jgi:hypothetical protein